MGRSDEHIMCCCEKLDRWLQRYPPRRFLQHNDEETKQARKDEADALLRALIRLSPQEDYESWTTTFLEELDISLKFPCWPTVNELVELAQNFNLKFTIYEAERPPVQTPASINARRIKDGEPVGAEWLSAARRQELLETGIVNDTDFKKYPVLHT